MKTFLKSLFAIGSLVVGMLSAPAAHASCPAGTSVPILDALGGYLEGLDEQFVSGRVFVLQDPTFNSGSADILCRAEGILGNKACQPEAGVLVDFKVTINADWQDDGVNACPI